MNPSLGPSTSGVPLIDAGAGLGLIAFIIVVAFVVPQSRKFVKLEKAQAGDAKSPQVQKKVRAGAGIVALLLAIVLILMIAGATI